MPNRKVISLEQEMHSRLSPLQTPPQVLQKQAQPIGQDWVQGSLLEQERQSIFLLMSSVMAKPKEQLAISAYNRRLGLTGPCLLYTSDAADE